MASLEDLQQRVALLEGQFDALATIAPGLEHVLLMRDVNVGLVSPLADREGLFWDATQQGFVNGPGTGSGVSGHYAGGSPVGTSVLTSTATNLDWPTLTGGSAILDLSTIDTPVTQVAGQHTIDATLALTAAAATGVSVLVLIRITDGTTPFGAETDATILGSATADHYAALSLTATVQPGSTVELIALQTSGGTIDVRVDRVTVTGPPPP